MVCCLRRKLPAKLRMWLQVAGAEGGMVAVLLCRTMVGIETRRILRRLLGMRRMSPCLIQRAVDRRLCEGAIVPACIFLYV